MKKIAHCIVSYSLNNAVTTIYGVRRSSVGVNKKGGNHFVIPSSMGLIILVKILLRSPWCFPWGDKVMNG
jgi:hypothetical protein